MDKKKYMSINVVLFLGLGLLLFTVIALGATKETTWIDTVLIPFGLSGFLVLVLNLMILGNLRKEKRKVEKESD